MDRQTLNRVKKKVRVLGSLKKDLTKLSGDLIGQVEDPAIREQLNKVRAEAMRGNRSPAEAMLRDLRNK